MKLYMVPLAPNPTKAMLYIAARAALRSLGERYRARPAERKVLRW